MGYNEPLVCAYVVQRMCGVIHKNIDTYMDISLKEI
jgi:hypothetical protein